MKENIINLPTYTDERGALTVVETEREVPFTNIEVQWFSNPQSVSDCLVIFLSGKGDIESENKIYSLDKRDEAFFAKKESQIFNLSNNALYLTIRENTETKDFPIRRLFYIYDIPPNTTRGKHMHQSCDEILFALRGSLDVKLDDGVEVKTISLDKDSEGLHIPARIWAEQMNFSKDAICLVLASEKYSEKGYIHSYKDFLKQKQNGD